MKPVFWPQQFDEVSNRVPPTSQSPPDRSTRSAPFWGPDPARPWRRQFALPPGHAPEAARTREQEPRSERRARVACRRSLQGSRVLRRIFRQSGLRLHGRAVGTWLPCISYTCVCRYSPTPSNFTPKFLTLAFASYYGLLFFHPEPMIGICIAWHSHLRRTGALTCCTDRSTDFMALPTGFSSADPE